MKGKTKLPDNHRRALSVTAQMVEQSLDEMEDLLRFRGDHKLTVKVKPTYTQEDRERLLEAISRMREANAEMFHALNLEVSPYTEENIITAKNTHMWTVLVDSKAHGLRGFGELPPDLARAVDAHIDKLLELLKDLA